MVTLDRLVNVLGGYGVRLRYCPISRSTELSSVVLHEASASGGLRRAMALTLSARRAPTGLAVHRCRRRRAGSPRR